MNVMTAASELLFCGLSKCTEGSARSHEAVHGGVYTGHRIGEQLLCMGAHACSLARRRPLVVEAVETDPGDRCQGYGRLLLLHTTEHLRSLGAHDVTCVIYRETRPP